jgi:hypothetical protein
MHGARPRDWSRHERVARVWTRRFERDMRAMGDEIERDMKDFQAGRDDWSEPGAFSTPGVGRGRRRRRRAAARAERAARSEGQAPEGAPRTACSGFGSSPLKWLWFYWWLAFPAYFLGQEMLEDAGGWAGVSSGVEGFWTWTLNFTLAAPLAHVLEGGMGVSFIEGFGLLALAALVSAAAAWIGLRAGPRDAA